MKKPTLASVRSEPCRRAALERYANDPDTPIRFDALVSESDPSRIGEGPMDAVRSVLLQEFVP